MYININLMYNNISHIFKFCKIKNNNFNNIFYVYIFLFKTFNIKKCVKIRMLQYFIKK